MNAHRDVLDRLERLSLRRSIVRLNPDLDWAYLERYAGVLGVREALEQIRGG